MTAPERNLPPDAQAWGRYIEKRIAELSKAAGIASTTARAATARIGGVARAAAEASERAAQLAQSQTDLVQEVTDKDESAWAPVEPEAPQHNHHWYDVANGNVLKIRADYGEYERINYVLNPSFRHNTAGWTALVGSLTRTGNDKGRLTPGAAGAAAIVETQGRAVTIDLPETPDDEDGEGGSPSEAVGVPWTASAELELVESSLSVTATLEVINSNDEPVSTSGPVRLEYGAPIRITARPLEGIEGTMDEVRVALSLVNEEEPEFEVTVDDVILEAADYGDDEEQQYFDGSMPGVLWQGDDSAATSWWDGEPRWIEAQDNKLKQELYGELEGLDADLADLNETVLPNLRDRLDDAEATLGPLPGQVAAVVQTAADAEQAALNAEQTAAAAEQAALDAAGIAEGKGQVITQISPPSGSRARAENLWVRLPDHKVHIYDGEQWVPATDPDLIAAANEAATARQEAQAAQSAAQAAQDAAQAAQTAAQAAQDAADALGTALAAVEGDLSDAQGLIDDLGEDVVLAATTAAVENLYVTGTGTVDELVANEIWAAKVAAQRVMAHEVLIGGQNLIPDPGFADPELTAARLGWSSADCAIEPASDDGMPLLRMDSTGYFRFWPTVNSTEGGAAIPVQPGQRIKFRVRYRWRINGGGEGDSFRIRFGWRDHDGGAGQFFGWMRYTRPSDTTTLDWQIAEHEVEVAEGRGLVYAAIEVEELTHGRVEFRDPVLSAMVDHSLIVDGGILARHITASEEMSAKLAEFLEVRVGQIIGDEAGFNSAVVNQLWADMFAARSITAEEADLDSIVADQAFIAGLVASEALIQNLILRNTVGGWTTEVSGQGLQTSGPDGQSAIQLGNYDELGMTLYNTVQTDDGPVQEAAVTLHNSGEVGGSILHANDEFWYGGTELSDILYDPSRPQGVVARTTIGSSRGPYATHTGIAYLRFVAKSGRRYRVNLNFRARNTTGNGVMTMIKLSTGTSSYPTPSINMPTLVQDLTFPSPRSDNWFGEGSLVGFWTAPGSVDDNADVYVTTFVTLDTITGTASVEWSRGDLWIEDIGAYYTSNSGYHLGGAPGTVPEPPPSTPVRNTRTFTHDWHRTWDGNGNIPSAVQGAAYQGRSPYYTSAGIYRSKVGIKSMTSTLSGATIKRVRVRVKMLHSHNGSGGTVVVGVHNNTSRPSTFTSGTNTYGVASAHFSRGQEKWITLPSSVYSGLINGSVRGISFYINSTNSSYYCYMDPKRTAIEVTYEK